MKLTKRDERVKGHRVRMLALVLLGLPSADARAVESGPIGEPAAHVFSAPGGVELKAYVFSSPLPKGREHRPGIVVFHGGGWDMGEPAWAFSRARHFAEQGMVAVAVQYRLSDQKSITPVDAMSDARAAIRWIRAEARSLGVDPKRIAAYGWSAGAHLAASAAVFDDAPRTAPLSAAPDALVLVSPAVSVASSSWFQRLLGERFNARDFSPDEHVREGLPPTLILQGSSDTVTPLPGVTRFCERLRTARNVCELHVYEGFGHLFTPAGIADDGVPQPDPATASDALARADRFLRSRGFMDQER
jgi:acetyl esterase/lipase